MLSKGFLPYYQCNAMHVGGVETGPASAVDHEMLLELHDEAWWAAGNHVFVSATDEVVT